MDFYLDFEATQFKSNIIAIGCSCEHGEFDCLVRPPRKDHITPFITNLTGISKEMSKDALEIEEAFIDFFSWISLMISENPEESYFHVYGDMDKIFLEKTASHIVDIKLKQRVLSLANALIDDSIIVRRYFNVKSIGVHQALSYFIPDLIEQSHDPLDDAILLQQLMSYIYQSVPPKECPFPEKQANKPEPNYIPEIIIPTKNYYIKTRHSNDLKAKPHTFYSYKEAINWAWNKIKRNHPEAQRKTVEKKVIKAINKKTTYLGWYFDKIYINEEEN